MSQCHSIIFDQGIIAPGHGKEVVDVPNATNKRYMYQLMSNVQLPGSKIFEIKILMHYCTPKKYVSMARNSKTICLRMIVNMESLIMENIVKDPLKENG